MSSLGQPLNAEIEVISVQKGETITARLAPIETYQQANLPFNSALLGTRVSVEKRPNGQPFLKATTPRPITEPFVELVVELNSENGRVTRQYTILLDPPGYGRAAADLPPPIAAAPPQRAAEPPAEPVAAAPAEPVAATPSVSAPTAETAPAQEETASAPEALPEPALAPSPRAVSGPIQPPPNAAPAPTASATRASEYGPIRPGETLTAIARSVQPEGATLEQTLIGLYRENPDAFIKKNMNLVKSGKILRIPDANEIIAVPQHEATREIHVQIADFNTLRGRLAERAPEAREAGSVTSGRIGASLAEPGISEPRDTVRVSKGEPPSGRGASGRRAAERVHTLEEEAVAREKALAEANDRIAQLEKTIKDMRRLAELKGGNTGQQQNATKTPQQASTTKPPVPTAAVITPPPTKEADATQAKRSTEAAKGSAETTAAAGKAVPKAEPPKSADAKGAQPKVAKAKAAPAPAPEPDLLETLFNEPLYMAAAGGAVLLGGLGFVMARRRRKPDDERKDTQKIAPRFGAAPAGATVAAAAATQRESDIVTQMPRAAAVTQREPEPIEDEDTVSESVENDAHDDYDHADSSEVAASEPAETMVEVPHVDETTVHIPDAEAVTDFGLEPPPPSPVEILAAQSSAAAHSGEAAQPGYGDFGLDVPTGEPVAAEAGPTPRTNVIDFNLDPLPGLDESESAVADETQAAISPVEEFKLDDLDLSLGAEGPTPSKLKDDHWYDVQQKFDLAKAYEEMGDKDGARDILQEVMKEGDAEQQAQAKTLLGALA